MTKSKLNGQYQPEYEHDVKKEGVPLRAHPLFR